MIHPYDTFTWFGSCVIVPIALALTSPTLTAQNVWHVDDDGIPPGTGTEGDPYTQIQYALSQASTVSGDTVLVHAGAYVENVNFLGKNIVLRSVDGAGVTSIDGSDTDNTVVFASGESSAAVLEGFTIRGGNNHDLGGGIRCTGSSPSILFNRIVSNHVGGIFSSSGRGGGLYVEDLSAPYVFGNRFQSNSAIAGHPGGDCRGGSIFVDASSSLHLESNLVTTSFGSNTVC